MFNKNIKSIVSKYYIYKNKPNEHAVAENEALLQSMRELIKEIMPFEKRYHSSETPSTIELNQLIMAAVDTVFEKNDVVNATEDQDITAKIILISSGFHQVFWETYFEDYQKKHNESENRLLTAIVAAQENERKRLAVTLHDDVVQSLAGILMRIQSLRNFVYKGDNDRLLHEFVEIEELFRKNIQKCRVVSFDMDSFWLEKAGFIPTLKSHIRDFENKSGIKVILNFHVDDNLSRVTQTHFFRVVQEALSNVKNHTEATEIMIKLTVFNENAELIIQDNGCGFVLNDHFWDELGANHFGLVSIEQRSRLLGGTFLIKTAPGCGTTLSVNVPVKKEKPYASGKFTGERRISPWIKSV